MLQFLTIIRIQGVYECMQSQLQMLTPATVLSVIEGLGYFSEDFVQLHAGYCSMIPIR